MGFVGVPCLLANDICMEIVCATMQCYHKVVDHVDIGYQVQRGHACILVPRGYIGLDFFLTTNISETFLGSQIGNKVGEFTQLVGKGYISIRNSPIFVILL